MKTDNLLAAQRLRHLRQRCQLSMRQLAGRAGVAVSYVSGVEAGRISPTIAMLRKILRSLNTDIGAFFSEAAAAPSQGFVFRRETMRAVVDAKRCYTVLLPARPDIRMIMLDEELKPGEKPAFEKLSGDLAGYIQKGTLLLEMEGAAPAELQAGDAFYIPACKKARGRALRQTPVRLVTAQILLTEKTRTAHS